MGLDIDSGVAGHELWRRNGAGPESQMLADACGWTTARCSQSGLDEMRLLFVGEEMQIRGRDLLIGLMSTWDPRHAPWSVSRPES